MHEERERGCPLKVTSRGTTSHNHEYLRTLLIVVGVAKCEYSSVSAAEREPQLLLPAVIVGYHGC